MWGGVFTGVLAIALALCVLLLSASITVIDIRKGGEIFQEDSLSPPMAAWMDEKIPPLPPAIKPIRPEGHIWLSTEEVDTTPLQPKHTHTQPLDTTSLTPRFYYSPPQPVSPAFSKAWAHYEKQALLARSLASTSGGENPIENGERASSAPQMPAKELVAKNTTPPLRQKWVGNIWVGLPSEWPQPPPASTTPPSQAQKHQGEGNDSPTGEHSSNHTMLSATSLEREAQTQRRLFGTLTLPEGVGYLGGLEVYREWGGFVFETARVDMINGLYEIVLSPPTAQGVLVAELRDQEKQLIGKKEIFLDEISRSEVPLHLEPRQPGFQGMVVLDNKNSQNKSVRPVVVEISEVGVHVPLPQVTERPTASSPPADASNTGLPSANRFSLSHLLDRSSFLMRLRTREFWQTLIFGTTVGERVMRILPMHLIHALNKEKPLDTKKGLIWGQVAEQNQPLSDVQVSTVEGLTPFYVNKKGEVTQHTGTFENGLFIFANVVPGMHILRATVTKPSSQTETANKEPDLTRQVAGAALITSTETKAPPQKPSRQLLGSHLVEVHAGWVSQVEWHLYEKKRVQVHVRDAFTGKPLGTYLRYMGGESVAAAPHGTLNLRHYMSNAPLHLELRLHGSDYPHILFAALRDSATLGLPVPSKKWLSQLSALRRVSQWAHRGTIVGFFDNIEGSVFPTNEAATGDLVLFNQNGISLPVEQLSSKGGFVLYNVPAGMHTLIFEKEKTERVITRTIPVRVGEVTVLDRLFPAMPPQVPSKETSTIKEPSQVSQPKTL